MEKHQLEATIGYTFNDRAYLTQALSHSSYANATGGRSNERLEFLGDAVLGYTAAEFLYKSFPARPEGDLTRWRAQMVCERSLVTVADRVGLRGQLLLGKGEAQSGVRDSIVADGVEALIGALYLDGGPVAARAFIDRFLLAHYNDEAAFSHVADAKTALQEYVQRERGADLQYRLVREEGPDHAKQFFVEVLNNGAVLADGVGRSKKDAEQEAARAALRRLGV